MNRFLSIDDNGHDLEKILNLLREHGYAGHEVTEEMSKVNHVVREDENRFRLMVETAEEGVWQVDREWRTTYVNRRMERMLGCEPGSMLGSHINDFMDDEGRRAVREYMCRREKGIREVHDFRFVRRDGSVLDALVSANPLMDERGHVVGNIAMVTDITDRKRTESVMAARMRLLQFAATHSLDELLEATLDEAERLTGSVIGFYHFLEPDQKTLSLQNWSTGTKREYCKAEGKGRHYDVSAAGVWVDCIHERRPVIHNDYASLPHRKGLPPGHAPLIRELVVPVFRGEKIEAIFGVGNKAHDYTPQDVETVSLLADLAWGIVGSKQAERERLANLGFFESMDKVNRAIQGAGDLDTMLRDVLNAVLSIFDCDWAYLMYPCDPDADSWSIPMESSKHEYPGAFSLRTRMPMTEEVAETLRVLLASDGPVKFGSDAEQALPPEVSERFGFKCFMATALYPRVGKPWQFGIHQCSYARVWTPEEERLLQEIGRRLGDGLTGMLAYRDLCQSEEKFRVLAETSPAAIVLHQGGKFLYVNPATSAITGFSQEELLEMDFWEWAPEECRDMVRERSRARLRGEQVPSQYEHKYITRSGEERWVLVSAGNIEYRGAPAVIATLLDITDGKRAEEKMRVALAEKVVLLKEVHHRVKNNLQIISSLLDLQSDYIHEDESRRYIRESKNRINSMALVHERLYKSENLSYIDFTSYVEELVASLHCSSMEGPERIGVKLEMGDIELGIDEAIPCGLIISELVSNSLNHAFPGDLRGEILIRGARDGEGVICLSVADTGIGLPPGFDLLATETLGLQIVDLLSRQLHGTVEMRGDHGVAVTIRFPVKE